MEDTSIGITLVYDVIADTSNGVATSTRVATSRILSALTEVTLHDVSTPTDVICIMDCDTTIPLST